MKENKIWGCITSSESIKRLSSYAPFFFANSNHILVIADEQPEGTVEMTDEFMKLFKADDWMFIDAVIGEVQKAQLEKYPEEAEKLQKEGLEFIARFRQELEGMRIGNREKSTQQFD